MTDKDKIAKLNDIINGCIAAFRVAAHMPGTADLVSKLRSDIMDADQPQMRTCPDCKYAQSPDWEYPCIKCVDRDKFEPRP